MILENYQPSLYIGNVDMMDQIAQLVNGDVYDAIDAVLDYIETHGWVWRKPEGYHGAVVDQHGGYHLLHMAHTFSDAVAEAFRLLKQYEKMGWVEYEYREQFTDTLR